MDNKAIYKLSYGLYVLTARCGGKDNGCIINTALQAASAPNQLSICVNKAVHTHDMIKKTGVFTVSVLSEAADFSMFQHFGMQSGRDVNKFADFRACRRGENGLYYITKWTNAYISVGVDRTMDLGSHTLFVGEITDMEVLNDIPSMTYDFYQEKVKPKSKEVQKAEGEKVPEDFTCPICNHPASDFERN